LGPVVIFPGAPAMILVEDVLRHRIPNLYRSVGTSLPHRSVSPFALPASSSKPGRSGRPRVASDLRFISGGIAADLCVHAVSACAHFIQRCVSIVRLMIVDN
jgi:hypothetical protein